MNSIAKKIKTEIQKKQDTIAPKEKHNFGILETLVKTFNSDEPNFMIKKNRFGIEETVKASHLSIGGERHGEQIDPEEFIHNPTPENPKVYEVAGMRFEITGKLTGEQQEFIDKHIPIANTGMPSPINEDEYLYTQRLYDMRRGNKPINVDNKTIEKWIIDRANRLAHYNLFDALSFPIIGFLLFLIAISLGQLFGNS